MNRADLLDGVLAGEHRALARAITVIENRSPGYRDLVSGLYDHTGNAEVVGITGSPGAGKSTLVDKLAAHYRDQGLTVGVIAVDPSSPYTGGAVLGDRVRMASNVGDMDVFVRSMGARGSLGGVSTATADAVKALDAFGKDRILIETVGAGQNEIDIVRTADTVAVLVQPGTGDNVQMLKAGILEIGDVFVVNKADVEGADRTVQELKEMIHLGEGQRQAPGSHHGPGMAGNTRADRKADEDGEGEDGEGKGDDGWTPRVVETVATTGEGVTDLVAAFDDHRTYLERSGALEAKRRTRTAEEIRTLLRNDAADLVSEEVDRHGGIDGLVDRVLAGESDPYTIADEVLAPVAACVKRRRAEAEPSDE